MSDPFTTALRDWQNFYETLGESSATLTGLIFVSFSLVARLLTPKTLPLVRTLTAPILGNFVVALVISVLMCVPTQTRPGLATELTAIGGIGLWRSAALLGTMRRYGSLLRLERRHWLWHLALPSVSSLCLPVAAAGLWRWGPLALDTVALAVLLLVVTGVVNAWEMALQTVQTSPEDMAKMEDL